jgi:hypothetical protein
LDFETVLGQGTVFIIRVPLHPATQIELPAPGRKAI